MLGTRIVLQYATMQGCAELQYAIPSDRFPRARTTQLLSGQCVLLLPNPEQSRARLLQCASGAPFRRCPSRVW